MNSPHPGPPPQAGEGNLLPPLRSGGGLGWGPCSSIPTRSPSQPAILPTARLARRTRTQREGPSMAVITNIEDLRVLAQRRVPRMFYDYADSGSWTEGTYRANESEFSKIRLRQRVAVNIETRSLRTKMIGEDVSMPVALAPTGLTGMQHAD